MNWIESIHSKSFDSWVESIQFLKDILNWFRKIVIMYMSDLSGGEWSQANYSIYIRKICFGIPQIKFHFIQLYPQFRGKAEKSPFLFLARALRWRTVFWKMSDAFLWQLFRLPPNSIRAFLMYAFIHRFIFKLKSFGVAPTSHIL